MEQQEHSGSNPGQCRVPRQNDDVLAVLDLTELYLNISEFLSYRLCWTYAPTCGRVEL